VPGDTGLPCRPGGGPERRGPMLSEVSGPLLLPWARVLRDRLSLGSPCKVFDSFTGVPAPAKGGEWVQGRDLLAALRAPASTHHIRAETGHSEQRVVWDYRSHDQLR